MNDLVRAGMVQARSRPWSWWDTTAARLVDAQLPGLADRVRSMGSDVTRRVDWADHLLAELGCWWSAVQARGRWDALDDRTRADLRTYVGSGSMAESIVYSSVFGAVLASLRTVATSLVVFDTQVVDLTEEISDPVDVLFGVQLGGGTDINRAIAYCQGLVRQPNDTVFVLISDLYEGGIAEEMLRRCAELVSSGVTMVALLALSDSGSPSYDVAHAAALADIGVPAFACTPDLFPDLMAAAIERRDISAWAAANDVVTAHQVPER